MPIIFDLQTDDFRIQIAHCTEPDEEWYKRLPSHILACDEWQNLHHQARKHEWLTSRVLMYELDGSDAAFDMQKDAFGKPFLAHRNEQFISLSHSGDYCAIMSAKVSCGIDIQYFTPKMARISDRFMRSEEWAQIECIDQLDPTQLDQTLHFYWSSKEAIYKAWGTKNLSAHRIHVLDEHRGAVLSSHHQIVKNYALQSHKTKDFECVWALEQ